MSDTNSSGGNTPGGSGGNEPSSRGISVENPDRARVPGGNMVRDILRRAAEADPDASAEGDADAAAVPPPPNSLSTETAAVRHVTFWRNGFSFGDGALLAYGDPANQALLAQVNAGLAPPRILNVVPGQLVELRVAKRITEDYTPPLPARPSSS